MNTIEIRPLKPGELEELQAAYGKTKDVLRLWTRTQIILLAIEHNMTAPQIGQIVHKNEQTVRRQIKRFNAEGVNGLYDAPRPGSPEKVTPEYRECLLNSVRQRPRALEQPYSILNLARLVDFMAEETGSRVSTETVRRILQGGDIVLSRPQHTISSPDPEYQIKNKVIEDIRDKLKAKEVFYYADDFNLTWLPTLIAMWSPNGHQVMIPTPGQTKKHYGIGAVNYHSGETTVLVRRHKRRKKIAELLNILLEKHPEQTIYVAWDNANTHQDDEVEAVLRRAPGRLILLYLPTYSPWLNPIEMLWRYFRREVTYCEYSLTSKNLSRQSTNSMIAATGNLKRCHPSSELFHHEFCECT